MTMETTVDKDEHELDLPALGDDDDRDGMVDEGPQVLVEMADDGAEPLDDAVAGDLPLDVEIQTGVEEPTVVGDDADGLDAAGDDDSELGEDGDSLLDDNLFATQASDAVIDEADDLGLPGEEPAPVTRGTDDGGAEGVDDPAGEHIDDLPPLDGDERDDAAEELDLGLEMEAPPALDDGED
jgi:hypothetical protein